MKCPHCGSAKIVKRGFEYAGGKRQRYLCKACGRIFTEGVKR